MYSTTDKATHNRTKAKSALLQNWNKFRHFCCKLSHCELCHEHQRSRRAGLMLDVIKTLPKSGRSNKKNKVPCEIPNVVGLHAHVQFLSDCFFSAALFQSACVLKLCDLAMKRDAAQISLPSDGDQADPRQHKHQPPPEKIRSFWVRNLPPNGLGHGITSACSNLPADGTVDDLKQIICQELSHPRFYLAKRAFRPKLNGNHQPYYIKLSTIDNTTPLTFEWAEPFLDENRPRLEYRP